MPQPESPSCLAIKTELEKIKELKQEFDAAFDMAVKTGKLERAEELKTELEQRVASLREKLEPAEFKEIRQHETDRNKKFFGEDFFNQNIKEIPPIPKEIKKEMVAKWEKEGFCLEYWPKVDMSKKAADGNKFPGWLHKPGKEYTPGQQYGIDFYGELQSIQELPENKNNPNLKNLAPTELPGCWVLQDARSKPDYQNGTQTYENDALMKEVLTDLKNDGFLNSEATDRRNNIHPDVFKKPEFWNAIKTALDIGDDLNATVRLPRVIEQNYRGHSPACASAAAVPAAVALRTCIGTTVRSLMWVSGP